MAALKIHSSSIKTLSSTDRSYVFKLLQLHLLPHIGVTPHGSLYIYISKIWPSQSRFAKILYICHAARELMRVALRRRPPDLRDNYRMKNLQTAGALMRNIVGKGFHQLRAQLEGPMLAMIPSLIDNPKFVELGMQDGMQRILKKQSSPFRMAVFFL